MSEHPGSWTGERCTLTFEEQSITVRLADRTYGPRRAASVLTLVRRSTPPEWAVGFGDRRGVFTPDDPIAFRDALLDAVCAEPGIAPLFGFVRDTAPSGSAALERELSLLETLEGVARVLGGAGFSTPAKATLDRMKSRYDGFLQLFVPQGWAFSRTIQSEGGYVLLVHAMRRAGVAIEPIERDRWLADRLLKYGDLTMVAQRVANMPLRAVWRWSFVVGDATRAALAGLYGPAAFAYLVAAEGMWGDLRERFGKRKWETMYKRGSRIADAPISEAFTWSRESLEKAQAVLSRQLKKTHDEPLSPAPTSRHGLLHGRVAGVLESHHAMKGLSVVDAILDQADEALRFLRPTDVEPPPWQLVSPADAL